MKNEKIKDCRKNCVDVDSRSYKLDAQVLLFWLSTGSVFFFKPYHYWLFNLSYLAGFFKAQAVQDIIYSSDKSYTQI